MGPIGDQWILYVLKKIFRKKSGQTTPQMQWYHIHGLAQDCSISIANALEILQSQLHETIGISICTCVWIKREYRLAHFYQFFNWFHGLNILLTDHPELRRITQPSIMGGPLGDPGFCLFRSTVEVQNGTQQDLNNIIDLVDLGGKKIVYMLKMGGFKLGPNRIWIKW